jgi:hypothetical protein
VRVVSSVAAAWVLSVGFDLFLHGGLLARVCVERQGDDGRCRRRHYRSVRLHSPAMFAARSERALLHAWLDLLQRLTLLAWLPFMIVLSWRITAQAGGVENAIM